MPKPIPLLRAQLEQTIQMARRGDTIDPATLARTVRRLVAEENAAEYEPNRREIDRPTVLAAIRLLGFDADRTTAVTITPGQVTAHMVSGTQPQSVALDTVHTVRIGPPAPTRRSTVAEPGPQVTPFQQDDEF